MFGKNVCYVHGGARGSGRPKTHGIYSDVLTDAEKAVWDDIPVGNVDHEIKLAKTRLARVLRAREAAKTEADANGMVIESDQTDDITATGGTRRVTRRLPDYDGLVSRYMSRIADLERCRRELLASVPGDSNDAAAKIRELVAQMETATNG